MTASRPPSTSAAATAPLTTALLLGPRAFDRFWGGRSTSSNWSATMLLGKNVCTVCDSASPTGAKTKYKPTKIWCAASAARSPRFVAVEAAA